jgi:hypothetical protein
MTNEQGRAAATSTGHERTNQTMESTWHSYA